VSYSKCILIGNIGNQPELRYLGNGTPVVSFNVATNERKKVNGERQDVTTWWRVTAFRQQAETIAQYLNKGDSIYVEGRPSLSTWTDKEGKERTTLEVALTEFTFTGLRQSKEQAKAATVTGFDDSEVVDDDVPF